MASDVRVSGPLFDGRAARAVTAFISDAEDEVAQKGVDMVGQQLDAVLKHPTGYYESQIRTDRVSDDAVVTDSGVVYGPWLEGTSSRNQSTSFKGYGTFRLVTQRLQAVAHQIAEARLSTYLRRMQ